MVSISSNWRTHLTIICLKTRLLSLKFVLASALRFSALEGDRGAGIMASPFASLKSYEIWVFDSQKTRTRTIAQVCDIAVYFYPQGFIE